MGQLRLIARRLGSEDLSLDRVTDLVLGAGGQVYVVSRVGVGFAALEIEGLSLLSQTLYSSSTPFLGVAPTGLVLDLGAGGGAGTGAGARIFLPLGFASAAGSAWSLLEGGAAGGRIRWTSGEGCRPIWF